MKISFTSGSIVKLTEDYSTLVLFNGSKKVYSATLDTDTAIKYYLNYRDITIDPSLIIKNAK